MISTPTARISPSCRCIQEESLVEFSPEAETKGQPNATSIATMGATALDVDRVYFFWSNQQPQNAESIVTWL